MKKNQTSLEKAFLIARSVCLIATSVGLLICPRASAQDSQQRIRTGVGAIISPERGSTTGRAKTKEGSKSTLIAKKTKKKAPEPPPVEPFELKGIEVGCTLAEFSAVSPFKGIPTADRANTSLLSVTKQQLFELNKQGSEPYTVATVEPDALQFRFVQKDRQWRLYKITVEFPSKDADTILTGLNSKYGKPMSMERVSKRSAGGTDIQSRDGVWDNEVSQIYFRETAGQIGKADLVFVHKELENAGLEPTRSESKSTNTNASPGEDL